MRKRKLIIKDLSCKSISLLVLLLILAFIILPIFWVIITGLKTDTDLAHVPPSYFPSPPTLKNFLYFIDYGALKFAKNSLIITLTTVICVLVLTLPTSYFLSRFRFPGRKIVIGGLVISQMFPGILYLIPYYQLFDALNLINTLSCVTISLVSANFSFSILILFTFIHTIPQEIDESAMIDGCSRFKALIKVIIPAAYPGIIAITIYNIVISWNVFLSAYAYITDDAKMNLQVALAMMESALYNTWGQRMAATTLVALPIIILFYIFQRYLVQGLTAGAVKE